jgi:hypothetical protein
MTYGEGGAGEREGGREREERKKGCVREREREREEGGREKEAV